MDKHTHNVSVSNHNHGFDIGGITIRDTSSALASIWDSVAYKTTNKKENENMETLYQVTVVAKNKEIILDKESVVAVDQENAKFMVGLYGILADRELTPADVTVIVTAIGQVKIEKESK